MVTVVVVDVTVEVSSVVLGAVTVVVVMQGSRKKQDRLGQKVPPRICSHSQKPAVTH